MSTTEADHQHHHRRHAPGRGPQARGRRHPRVGRRPGEELLRRPRLAAGRRLRLRQRLPSRPVQPAGLAGLGAVRHRHHHRRAGLGAGPVPGRLRRPGRPRPDRRRAASRSARSSTRSSRAPSSCPGSGSGRVNGRDEAGSSYGSFATFADPDGNTWLLQEVTTRLPGRIDSAATSFASVHDLEQALIRAATAHGEHEARNGGRVRRAVAGLVRDLHGRRAVRHRAARVTSTSETTTTTDKPTTTRHEGQDK